MRAGSIFSGIGGIELGLGLPVAWHVENDPHASSILERHFPGVPNLGDITRVEWSRLEPVDLLVGGPPCQPISSAGQRKGAEDDRWLWPFAIDAIRALGPRFFLLENPTDLLEEVQGWHGASTPPQSPDGNKPSDDQLPLPWTSEDG